MKTRLWGFVEHTFLYKIHYHICLHNTAISRNANRLFLFYQKNSNFKLFLICILNITPSFLNKIQKVFLRKWSAKKALQSLIEENFSKHFVFDFWWKYPEKKPENFSENMLVGSKFSLISLWKSGHFAKNHIYSERGNFGASSYDKTST